MTGPNLDKDIEHILVNVALNGAYEDAGQRVLSQGTIVKAKKYIDLLIANQVREARLDELIGVRGWTEYEPDPKYSPAERFHIVPYTYLTNRIAELNGVKK